MGLTACCGLAAGVDLSLPVTGNLLGVVTDVSGTPQMGATIQLFNKYERVVASTLTAPDGRFAFAALPIDVYSIRVTMATFLPVSRDRIAVRAGMDSLLRIHVATLLSSIEVNYTVPTGAMTDDWKWVLRSSPATRPITRFLPELASANEAEMRARVFSGTHAVLSVSGGDGGLVDADSTGGDFGTGFALSTNVLGKNQIQIGGAYGQNGNVGPTTVGLCAIYSRSQSSLFAPTPEVTFTMAQLGSFGMAGNAAQLPAGNGAFGTMAAIRTMSLGLYEVADPIDNVHVEYGITGETIDGAQHTSRISPFARLTVGTDSIGTLVVAYSDGGRPDELTAHSKQDTSDVDSDTQDATDALGALSRLPQLSERNRRLELQRTQNYEAGYRRTQGSITYAVSGFYEDVSNGRMYVAGNLAPLNSEDLLSDGVSTASTYNIGNYRRKGYVGSINDRLGDRLDVALVYGRMGGFTADPGQIAQSPGGQRFLSEHDRNVAAANVSGKVPVAGTMFTASYGWVDAGTIVPRHVFTTQNASVSPGLNIDVRQPLPSLFGMPGRMELTAHLRNLLAQGYLPIADGSQGSLLIVQAPRDIRGGLNFIF